jgi:hypothetical protein
MLTYAVSCVILYAYHERQSMRLKDTTFILGDKPMRELLWCNKVPKGKRNKPSKINGIQHHEISESVEHVYYQSLN